MNEAEFRDALEDILNELTDDDAITVKWTSSYKGRKGLTVRLDTGDEFQLTIVQSKRA